MCKFDDEKSIKIGIAVVIFCVVLILSIIIRRDAQWTVDDLYGEWKVTELIQKSKGSYGLLPLGNEIGRSFIISEDRIIDSKVKKVAEQEEQACYSMKWAFCESNVYKDSLSFQKENDIYLQKAGITSDVIYEFVFGEEDSPLEFCIFSYDEDRMAIWLHGGYYMLERAKYIERSDNPYGEWYVEEMISRGTGDQEGIDFFQKYGMCYQLDETFVKKGFEEAVEDIEWRVEQTDRTDFERLYGIKEGLGICDQKIEVWYAYKSNEIQAIIIPVFNDKIVMQIEGQWFRLSRILQYSEPKVDMEEVMDGEWKYTQFLGSEAENVDTQDIALMYTESIVMNPEEYIEGAVSEAQIEICKASDIIKEKGQIEFLNYFFGDDDLICTAKRSVLDKEQFFVLIDKKTLLFCGEGLWFRIEKI